MMKNTLCCSKNLRSMKKCLCFILLILIAIKINAQINEPAGSGIYDYLYRMAQKGLIKWNDYQLPLDRKDILTAIDQLSSLQNRLTKIESSELKFYRQEYAFDR